MPGGRRGIGRLPPPKPHFGEDGIRGRFGFREGEPAGSIPVQMPKHLPIPDIPCDSDLLFELIIFAYTAMALFLQYLNLYRTVWWLPHSYTSYAVNFYLIDMKLVCFILIVLGRRLLWCLCVIILTWFTPHTIRFYILFSARCTILSLLVAILSWCAYHIVFNHPLINMFYLCSPIVVYGFVFGPTLTPFFDLIPHTGTNISSPKTSAVYPRPLVHLCSNTPENVRNEVHTLKSDFNKRMGQVLFNSLLNAYYAGFVPCCFAQSTLHYDKHWMLLHLLFVWLSCFIMYVVHCYPPRYCDTLHKSALHLGKWSKIEGRGVHIPYHIWSESNLWHQGALVKYMKELFKAEGITNAAEPGNISHLRFYTIFSNPALPVFMLLGLQCAAVLLQMLLLLNTNEWNHTVALALLLFSNYYILFKLARDYLVLRKVYKLEQMIQDKSSSS